MALIDGSPRAATARAKTACEVAPITEKSFLFLVHETPFFAIARDAHACRSPEALPRHKTYGLCRPPTCGLPLRLAPAMIGRTSTRSFLITPLSLLANLALRRPRNIEASTLGRDAMAGAISAVVQIAYCISFAALIFTGDLAGGFSLGLAGLIMGTVVTCVVIAVTSTFSPVIGGPDSPAVAVMSVLAASIATALAAKGASTPTIIVNVLVALSVSTLLTGILLYGVGALSSGNGSASFPIR